ncbi:GNAT family N-acetyltransferase [Propionicicella superfundia]|uniref:GNAT family N-acetyltransferase n=1 Tax=Propionicicella superfundia TaxID=348582 RepID=UPI0003F83F72|nr:GNAT family N-acetyltransferase [Propionicicella superfundia]
MTEDVRGRLLREHDEQVRCSAEVDGATDVARIGPLWLGRFGTRGFVSYRDLDGATGGAVDTLIGAAIAHFRATPEVRRFEWKTRGHDAPADLEDRLLAAGLSPEPIETVMAGAAHRPAGDVRLGPEVTVRRLTPGPGLAAEVRAVGVLHKNVFGPGSPDLDADVLAALTTAPERNEVWIVETGDRRVVGAARLSLPPGTRFAGLWGGAVDPSWRHHGLYRALTAARARSALAMGATHVYAECTPASRPILERSGLLAITTTTPYVWTA